MAMPTDIGIVDLMLGIPDGPKKDWYAFLKPLVRDNESQDEFEFPAQYMFKDVPDDPDEDDNVAFVLGQMDRHGIDQAMIGYVTSGETGRALREHPDRFLSSVPASTPTGAWTRCATSSGPWPRGPSAPRSSRPGATRRSRSTTSGCTRSTPSASSSTSPSSSASGVPGPRVPMACQHMELVDEVCWFFPELRFVTRHGCEPWTELAVKLLLKWPNLYYSTSAFAPKYYPRAIIDYANTRGADKIMYAGYFPMGLSLDRIMRELPNVPLKDEVWPKFLRDNARRVLKLDERGAS